MGLFGKKFGAKRRSEEQPNTEIKAEGNSVRAGDVGKITFLSDYVGSATGSAQSDFYVYEWFIKDTGEIFYVGKGRGDRYKEYHERAYEAEKIRKLYNTDVRFVEKNLTEDKALQIENQEIIRILDETNDRLTNLIIPLTTKRDNGYAKSPKTPPFQFETASVLYASEIEEYYYNTKFRPFDNVDIETLSHPVIIDKGVSREEICAVYGGDYEKYYKETIALLEQNGSKIIESRFAKSVTAWIYPGDDYVTNYDKDEEKAEERIGRRIPAYHLIDVWKTLKERLGDPAQKELSVEINPVHNRVPISRIKNRNDWDKGFNAGFKYWEEGESERKKCNTEKAIELFDEARYNGYFTPALYKSYAMAYRKLKDLDNEVAILDEAIGRYRAEKGDYSQLIIMFDEQRKKAIEKLKKRS